MTKVSKKEPLISIIVPVYNGEKYITQTLDKLIALKCNKEVIVINDCSKDKSLDILQRYKEQIKLIDLKENKGVSNARNLGIKKANGKYIGFVDIDDSIDKTIYEKMLTEIEKHKADICVCNYIEIFENSNDKVNSKYTLPQNNINNNEGIALFLTDQISPAIWDKIYTKKLLSKVNFKKGLAVGEDILFCLNAFLNSNKTCFVDEPLYYYLQQNNSVMHTISPKLLQFQDVTKNIPDEIKQFLKRNFKEEFEYFELEMITRGIHSISTLCNKTNKKQAQAYLKNYYDKDSFSRIIKSRYYSKSIKLEIFILKQFGIKMHLFLMPIYKFIRNRVR